MKFRMFITITASAVASVAYAANDIAGVQIGVPISTARPLVIKANPSYEFTDIKLSGRVVGLTALSQKDGRVVDQFVVIHNDAGVVWFAARAQSLERGSRIKPETLLHSMEEKYGQPSEISIGSGGPMWQFDRQGQVYRGQLVPGPCYSGIGAGASTPMGKVIGTAIEVPRNFTPRCGSEISTWVLKDPVDKMVSAFSVQIVDSMRMYDELNGKATKSESDRQRQLQGETAKDTKPKL